MQSDDWYLGQYFFFLYFCYVGFWNFLFWKNYIYGDEFFKLNHFMDVYNMYENISNSLFL